MKAARGRLFLRVLAALGGVLGVLVTAALADGWRAFGKAANGERKARMTRSPEWKGGHFENPQPLVNDAWETLEGAMATSPDVSPRAPVPTSPIDKKALAEPPASGLRVTWMGHSTTLVEVDGHRFLTDPVWSTRVSPVDGVGPTRWYPPGIALADLPPLDAVLVSHDHYDHLDYPTILALKDMPIKFVVPLGVAAHLEYWGVPVTKIVELDWWEDANFGDLRLVCVPARHASGRFLTDKDATLWAGYALVGRAHRAYYSGDTGLFPAMHEIGAHLGPFDVTMIEVGQYDHAWPDWHIGPEQAVVAHGWVRGQVMVPIHWAALALAYHAWTEPIERATVAAARAGVTMLTPKPGQSVEPGVTQPIAKWWPAVPFKTAEENPIVSSQTGL
jgi:L-ascorbate metabolism protein UlaG (beta-lactamase superfamily)